MQREKFKKRENTKRERERLSKKEIFEEDGLDFEG